MEGVIDSENNTDADPDTCHVYVPEGGATVCVKTLSRRLVKTSVPSLAQTLRVNDTTVVLVFLTVEN
jgi:hypothetical protein